MAPPRIPVRWVYHPDVIMTRNDDGTFRIAIDWMDSFENAYDENGTDITDVREIGTTVMDGFLTKDDGQYQYDLASSYLPDGWVEPETEEEKQRREMLVELQEISAALSAATSNRHTLEA